MEKGLEFLKWFTTLDSKNILKVLLVVIFTGIGYYIYLQIQTINDLNVRIDTLNNRYNTDTAILQKVAEECNTKRIEEAGEIGKYWRDKYEQVFEREARNYKNINEIKTNQ